MDTETLSLPQIVNQEWCHSLFIPPKLQLATPLPIKPRVRLIRLDEINEERHQTYRQALAHVYAALDPALPVRLLYLLSGSPNGVALYLGVITDSEETDLHEAMKHLRGALEGQLPGINFGDELSAKAREGVIAQLCEAPQQGVILGAPTPQAQDEASEEQNFQGIDRLVRALQSSSHGEGRWQVAVVSQPMAREQIHDLLNTAYGISSRLGAMIRTSVQASSNTSRQKNTSWGVNQSDGSNEGISVTRGKSETGTQGENGGNSSTSGGSYSSTGTNSGWSKSKAIGTNEGNTKNSGTSHTDSRSLNYSVADTDGGTLGVTQELANKRAQHLADYLDKQLIARLQKGLSNGLFHTVVYFTAEHSSTYLRLKNLLRSIYQGSESTLSPLEAHDLPGEVRGHLLQLPQLQSDTDGSHLLFHSLSHYRNKLGSLLTADELSIMAGLPEHELQGVRRRKTVNFIVDLPDVVADPLDLGVVIDRGRRYPNNRVHLSRADLNKHLFVTGVTGSGKTTTCLNLLLESGLPFLVIEPAKTEYRELARQRDLSVDYYRPNGDSNQSLRINPFALLRKGQRIKSHAGFLKNVFAAVFPMEASMPMMVEAAILAAYEDKGWDLDENEYLPGDDPFDPISQAWPTMSDMIGQLDRLIPTYGLGREFEEKYRGSLISRLRSLTDGTLGQVLNVPQSIDFSALLQRHAVIELEELQGGEEKALLMALLLGAISETMRDLHATNPAFRQLTLIEEAHRLLSRPEPGDKAAALAVESFADMLAEVRKYGCGLIIADQIPAKLIPDVIKNTHSKIVHRLFAEDDRRAMGEAMMMDEAQRNYLPNLATGEAIVFCGGWHGSAHAAIRSDHAKTDNTADSRVDLATCSIRQLWNERARYFPRFSRLNWLEDYSDQPNCFARFVREARQARHCLLDIIQPAHAASDTRAKLALTRLKSWLERWKNLQQPLAVDDIDSHALVLRPDTKLGAAWLALLLDANPTPQAQEKNVPSLIPRSMDEWNNLVLASNTLLVLLHASDSIESLTAGLKSPSARDLQAFCVHLKRFKRI